MSRIIGLVHRIKQTAENEARPTLVCVSDEKGKKGVCHKLETETDELDFLLDRFPTKYRAVVFAEDVSDFRPHQVKWRKAEDGEMLDCRHPSQIHREKKVVSVVDKVPAEFDGLKTGDKVVMCLGGSGDRLAFAMTRHGQDIGSKVLRVATKHLKEFRGEEDDKDDDHKLLVKMFVQQPEHFREASTADLKLIDIRVLFDQRMDAMKERIKCEQRLGKRLVGKIYLNKEGKYPEGAIEDMLLSTKANDTILLALLTEENKRNRELEEAVSEHIVFKRIFELITGCGVRIAAPIIAFIGDIRRFETASAFKQYCGVAPNAKGEFQRKRRNEPVSWRPEARQSLYLIADQFNRRPDSEWGKRFLAEKARLRLAHPDVVEIQETYTDKKGKTKTKTVKKYTNGHIHKMARWHTLGKFMEKVYEEWTDLINNPPAVEEQPVVAKKSRKKAA